MSLSNLYYGDRDAPPNKDLYDTSGYDSSYSNPKTVVEKPVVENTQEDGYATPSDSNKNTADRVQSISDDDIYYFNDKYQELMALPDSVEKFMLLSDFNADFAYAVATFGKIIISERNLPVEKKTIKPINAGGIAGGEKFLHKGIFFKYATDTLLYTNQQGVAQYMYGGSVRNDELAMKAAGNELRAIHRFAEACRKVKEINTPLMSLCDYHGFRLIAVSVIPIDANTIIYGSSNGGRNVHNSVPEINSKMMNIGQLLNLKGHLVGGVLIHGPGDIEVHKGMDGKYYAIDFGRLYSPEAPVEAKQDDPRAVFYKHLRPEFIRSNKVPLSSDAFTKWQGSDPNAEDHNNEVKQATSVLFSETIPQFAKELNTKGVQSTLISEYMHAAGINYRHLGKLRNAVSELSSRKSLLTIMFARCVKVEIYRNLRKLSENEKAISDVSYKRHVANLMNLISQPSKFLEWFFTRQEGKCSQEILGALVLTPGFAGAVEVAKSLPPLKQLIVAKFGRQALSDAEYALDNSLHKLINFGELYRLLQNMKCFHISTEAINDWFNFAGGLMLWESDVISVEPKVKFLSWIDFCDGFAILQKGMQLNKSFPVAVKRLFQSARNKLHTAWASHSENEEILYHFGVANFELGKTLQQIVMSSYYMPGKEEVAHILEMFEMAGDCFYRAYMKSKLETEEHLSQMFLPRQKSFLDSSSEGVDNADNLNIVGVNQWKLSCIVKAAEAFMRLGVMTTFQYSGIHPNSTAFTSAGIMLELAHQLDKSCLQSKMDEALLADKEWAFASFIHLACINPFIKETLRAHIQTYKSNPKYLQIVLSKGARQIPYLCTQLQIQTLIELYQGLDTKVLDISDCTAIPDESLDLLFKNFGKTLEDVKLTGLTIKPTTAESIGANCKALKVLVLNQTNLSEEAFDHFLAKTSRFGKSSEERFKGLQELHMNNTIEISEKKIISVVKKLPSLKKLSIKGCRVTASGVEELQAAKPGLAIDHTTGDSGISGPITTNAFAEFQDQ